MKIIKFNETLTDISSTIDDCFQEVTDIKVITVRKYFFVQLKDDSISTSPADDKIDTLYNLLSRSHVLPGQSVFTGKGTTLEQFSDMCGILFYISITPPKKITKRYIDFKWDVTDTITHCIKRVKRMKDISVKFEIGKYGDDDVMRVYFYPESYA